MAQFSTAAIFSNHMVLQRNKYISVFGYGQNGQKVNVTLLDSKNQPLGSNNTTVKNERWELKLPSQTAQTGCSLIVTGPETFTFSDLAIGEVWLCGGQSNMEFELQNCTEGPEALQENNPNIRFYYTNKIGWMDENFYSAEKSTCWQTWESESKGAWSAIGFFFAKKLEQELNCVIGLVGCNWGGTSASAWMKKEYLEKDTELCTYLTEQEEATKGKSIEQQCKEYDDYLVENDAWQKKYSELWAKDPNISWEKAAEILGPCPWPGPHSCKNPYRPTGLYECMLSRIIPYTLRGVLWYQGESDDHKPKMYCKLFSTMIDNWRTDWNDNELPFVFVQLPVNRYENDKDFKHWCLIREAQAKVHTTIKNVWMTCGFDLGQYSDIHPKGKKEIGERLCRNALANVYNKIPPADALSPILKNFIINQPSDDNGAGTITLVFSNADDGFIHKENTEILENYKKLEKIQGNELPDDFTGFEIAGQDGIYYPATFAFGGTENSLNTIILCSKKVPEPLYARYCWYNYGPATVYGKNGLPLVPFRTSLNDDKSSVGHAEIQQIMTVNS